MEITPNDVSTVMSVFLPKTVSNASKEFISIIVATAGCVESVRIVNIVSLVPD
jgi:hypothetical protein